MKEFIIGTASFRFPFYRQINYQRTPDDAGPGNKSPITAVRALFAVITHDKVFIPWDHKFAVADMLLRFRAPAAINVSRTVRLQGKVIAISIIVSPGVDRVAFLQRRSV